MIELKTDPRLIKSPYLSDKTGLNIWVLDYSFTDTGTHKLKKAITSVQKAKEQNKKVLLHINPVVDSRQESNGSGIDALELACAVYYPKAQVVSVVHSEENNARPEFNSDFINPNVPGSRKRITCGLNLNKFMSKQALEDYFKGSLGDCLDVTNLEDYSCYHLSKNRIKELKENKISYLVGSAGTGERALGQLESIEGLTHIVSIPNGHILDPFHRQEDTNAKRILARFKINTHDKLIEKAVGNKDVLFKSVGLFGEEYAKQLFERAIEKGNSNMKTSYDGAIGFSILREKDVLSHEKYFTRTGLKVFNSYLRSEKGFNYQRDNEIPLGSNICIVNTGISNNKKLRNLIEVGAVK